MDRSRFADAFRCPGRHVPGRRRRGLSRGPGDREPSRRPGPHRRAPHGHRRQCARPGLGNPPRCRIAAVLGRCDGVREGARPLPCTGALPFPEVARARRPGRHGLEGVALLSRVGRAPPERRSLSAEWRLPDPRLRRRGHRRRGGPRPGRQRRRDPPAEPAAERSGARGDGANREPGRARPPSRRHVARSRPRPAVSATSNGGAAAPSVGAGARRWPARRSSRSHGAAGPSPQADRLAVAAGPAGAVPGARVPRPDARGRLRPRPPHVVRRRSRSRRRTDCGPPVGRSPRPRERFRSFSPRRSRPFLSRRWRLRSASPEEP